jgi:hypothetical protein
VEHYSLQAIIAVGFKIENERAVQFRKWANRIVKDYTIQGWTMDAERLKHGGTLTDGFFERQLEKIREIRLSERKFYQKITDITPPRWTTTRPPRPRSVFSQRSKTRCTAPCTAKRQLKSSWIVPITSGKTWG